jgi:tRNA(fMet)-specific endonuclease VapC
VFQRLEQIDPNDVYVCSIVKLELRYGALRSDYVAKTLAEQEKFLNRFVSLPFDDAAHHYAAQLRADLARLGTPVGPYDLLIASIALTHHLILVTHNTREFGRVAGLQIEDWEI